MEAFDEFHVRCLFSVHDWLVGEEIAAEEVLFDVVEEGGFGGHGLDGGGRDSCWAADEGGCLGGV